MCVRLVGELTGTEVPPGAPSTRRLGQASRGPACARRASSASAAGCIWCEQSATYVLKQRDSRDKVVAGWLTETVTGPAGPSPLTQDQNLRPEGQLIASSIRFGYPRGFLDPGLRGRQRTTLFGDSAPVVTVEQLLPVMRIDALPVSLRAQHVAMTPAPRPWLHLAPAAAPHTPGQLCPLRSPRASSTLLPPPDELLALSSLTAGHQVLACSSQPWRHL